MRLPEDQSYLSWRDSTETGTIVACRTDGLGERLNAILNGLYLSRLLGVGFAFGWSTRLQGVSGHSIALVEEFFSKDFITKYMVEPAMANGPELAGKGLSIAAVRDILNKSPHRRIAAPRLALDDILAKEIGPGSARGLADAFAAIGFDASITEAIDAARQIPGLSELVVLHLRSGDVFYGNYRKWVHYTYKGVTLPVAKMVIRHYRAQGKEVLLIGQDTKVINYLCEAEGAHTLVSLGAPIFSTSAQAAMFDIILMSQCNDIVAGSSGFAKLASWIKGTTVKKTTDLFNHKEMTDFSLEDLEANGDSYDRLQAAFAYWFAYYYGRQSKSLAAVDRILTAAYRYDPDNQLYPLIQGFAHYAQSRFAQGEAILGSFLERECEHGLDDLFAVLTAKTTGAYNLAPHIPYLETAAINDFPYAMSLLARFKEDAGDELCARLLKMRALDLSPRSEFLRMAALR